MNNVKNELTLARLAAIGSALVSFGLIQGTLYLKAYWGTFGLDPFQFIAVSDLAMAGTARIGLLLLLIVLAVLWGGALEPRIPSVNGKRKIHRWVGATLILLLFLGIMWWSKKWGLLAGVILTAITVAVVRLSPVLPATVKDSPWLIYLVVMVVYVSVASGVVGADDAQKIIDGKNKHVAAVKTHDRTVSNLALVGRLGDTYAFWDPDRRCATLIPASDIRRIESARRLD